MSSLVIFGDISKYRFVDCKLQVSHVTHSMMSSIVIISQGVFSVRISKFIPCLDFLISWRLGTTSVRILYITKKVYTWGVKLHVTRTIKIRQSLYHTPTMDPRQHHGEQSRMQLSFVKPYDIYCSSASAFKSTRFYTHTHTQNSAPT